MVISYIIKNYMSFLNCFELSSIAYQAQHSRTNHLKMIQGHQPEMSDSVKIFLRDAKKHRFQIDFFWKSIDCRFLYQNFDLCQIVCLLHGFEVTAKFPPQNWFPVEICLQSIFDLLSFLNDLSYRCEIGLVWKIVWCSFRNLTKSTNNSLTEMV